MGLRQAAFLTAFAFQTVYSSSLMAIDRRIPDEYESSGGHALGLDNTGVAAMGGVSAVKLNPALLPLEPQYTFGFGYHWPSLGREYYQLGVVDSTTSSVALGVSATGFQQGYVEAQSQNPIDAATEKRVTIAAGKAFSRVSLGLGGQWVTGRQAASLDNTVLKGTTINAGLAGLITSHLRFGLSAENLSNDRVSELAPRFIRGGVALLMANGDLTFHVDYRQRERIASREGDLPDLDLVGVSNKGFTKDEQMVVGSFSARIYDVLRVLGAYGQSVSQEDDRRSLSGGIGLVHNLFSLTFASSRPYLAESTVHHSVNLNLQMSM